MINEYELDRKNIIVGYTLVAVMTISMCIQLFFGLVYIPYTVSGNSMDNTLHNGDTVMVKGYDRTVEHDDIVVFKTDGGDTLIKRVVGLPGDHVTILDGAVYIDGALDSHRSTYYDADESQHYMNIIEFDTCDISDDCGVPEGHMFVLGDNRDVSKDSRHIGFINEENIIGVVDKNSIFTPNIEE